MSKHKHTPKHPMKVILKWAAMVLCVGWFLLVVMVLIADRSPAQEYEFRAQYGCWVDQWTGRCNSYGYRWVRRADRERGYRYREHHRHYGYRAVERDHDDSRRGHEPECKAPLSVVGDASLTQDGAKYEGEQSWIREVRWRFGAAYSDMNNARHIRWGCGRSSVRNIPGTTRPLQFTCELSAQPCRVKKEKEEVIVTQPPPSGRPAP